MHGDTNTDAALPGDKWGPPKAKEPHVGGSLFRLFVAAGEEDTCAPEPSQLHGLSSCGFNATNPLIIIGHGWSEHYEYSFRKFHLIGYSLGAHISGFAGSYFKGPERIGRNPSLDPAGPLFEGVSPVDRLSPDDAEFTDAIHTFTHGRLGLSVGIKQPVAHYGFYPNGGDFQPGCDLRNIYEHISEYGPVGFGQTVKCAHERCVHLFIDSVLDEDQPIRAYGCSNNRAFDKGACLDCRRNRCNTLGYNIEKVRTAQHNKRLELKTRSRMPRRRIVHCAAPCVCTLTPKVQYSYTFLITLNRHWGGGLMLLTFHWKGSALWKNVWNRVQTIMPWGGHDTKPLLTVGKISVKDGDTQDRPPTTKKKSGENQRRRTRSKTCSCKSVS
ncbi:LOW QUALITY PROTEIN: hepatic triacylglycerol lipase [Phycodurus eques]|uniref:LOW QUALITY PROTEIN: hepatic triacylglycerol lipase n=1 Tax=Phycodurus eques TaxID=693459 RepID=UPI002ACEB204|nr:LOW QUALITY PROTEIN: hepatic triacylglycerol lipase [Phycodurus eques]